MAIICTVFFLIVYCSLVYGGCHINQDESTKNVYDNMKKWKIFGNTLTVFSRESTFSVGICSSPFNATDVAAIIQKESNVSYVLGKLDQVNLIQGDKWILLTYENGDEYDAICNNLTRSASIMFVCGSNMVGLTILQAHTTSNQQCNYMFQLQVPEMCPIVEKDDKLSGGAIFLIVIGSLAAAYLILGAVYMHVKHGARGIEHIPNLEMWRKMGGLAADGCDFCCRCERTSPRAGYFFDESGLDAHDDDILSP
ncbi:unnamed protein product [Rotaria socialis]|uniref:MRH domain-containing protein n=1 Tax=Rotaria socialis TaxID=392032 RepID=A0A818LCX7_9BILA|nr:unnamed protein product [Rotaria socialis]CAF4547810.1 unnamed protein product [Rotaria socialis]